MSVCVCVLDNMKTAFTITGRAVWDLIASLLTMILLVNFIVPCPHGLGNNQQKK